jgi:cytochrome c-type biogenesis protein CcmH/NrfG
MTEMSLPSDAPDGGTPPLRRPPTEDLVRDALAKDAHDVDALFVLAALRVQDGHSEESLRILDQVLGLDPGYPGAWFFKEKLHRMRGEARQADSARRRGEALER